MSNKSKVWIVVLLVVVLCLLAVVAFLLLRDKGTPGEESSSKPGTEAGDEEQKTEDETAAMDGVLFFMPQGKGDFIYLTGRDLANGEEESKEVALGKNSNVNIGDGKIFLSGTGVYGINAMVYYGEIQQNLISIVRPMSEVAFDENGLIAEFGLQITVVDVDEDGLREALLSVGTPGGETETALFKLEATKATYLGTMPASSKLVLEGNGVIKADSKEEFILRDGVLSGNLVGPSESDVSLRSEELAGQWVLYDEENYFYSLVFGPGNAVSYMTGIGNSEMLMYYEGTYFIEGNVCVLDMFDQQTPSDMYPDYQVGPPIYSRQKIEVKDESIILEYVSGDKLLDDQAVGVLHEFVREEWEMY